MDKFYDIMIIVTIILASIFIATWVASLDALGWMFVAIIGIPIACNLFISSLVDDTTIEVIIEEEED